MKRLILFPAFLLLSLTCLAQNDFPENIYGNWVLSEDSQELSGRYQKEQAQIISFDLSEKEVVFSTSEESESKGRWTVNEVRNELEFYHTDGVIGYEFKKIKDNELQLINGNKLYIYKRR